MSPNRLAFPLSAAALAVLLAACGSDSGSGSPDSGGAAPKDAPAAAAQAPAVEAAATEAASAEKATADQGPLIDANGVRGDLLLSMMDHQACHHSDLKPAASYNGPEITADPLDVRILHVKTELDPINYQRVPDARWPANVTPGWDYYCSTSHYTYAPFTDGTRTLTQRTQAYTFRGSPDLRALRPFPLATTRTPITLTGNTVTLGTNQETVLASATVAGEAKHALISANAFTFQTDARVPYGVLSRWGQDETFTELLLLSADNARQAKLCWNVHVGAVRRLHCTVWDVPEGWQRGKGTLNLQDQYVIDDRSIHPGESGHRYFRGNF